MLVHGHAHTHTHLHTLTALHTHTQHLHKCTHSHARMLPPRRCAFTPSIYSHVCSHLLTITSSHALLQMSTRPSVHTHSYGRARPHVHPHPHTLAHPVSHSHTQHSLTSTWLRENTHFVLNLALGPSTVPPLGTVLGQGQRAGHFVCLQLNHLLLCGWPLIYSPVILCWCTFWLLPGLEHTCPTCTRLPLQDGLEISHS